MNVGNRIKTLREKLGLSNSKLATLAGLSQPVMNRLENNERSADIETLEKICSALNITLVDFLKDSDNCEPLILTPELKDLINGAKSLNTEQLQKLNEFIKTIK
ncbi:helix-turn-helix domain-containing protein [Clostridium sp. WILCCON 0269]|uniref:Helix-turn-helix domain-containing protein n=1 Tax=Candidatus Clostridium eludens TaxID=3381663 RepID=A0ABW8SSM8_9CLOT